MSRQKGEGMDAMTGKRGVTEARGNDARKMPAPARGAPRTKEALREYLRQQEAAWQQKMRATKPDLLPLLLALAFLLGVCWYALTN